MAVLTGALACLLVGVGCLIGVKMLLASIGIQFNFLRGAIIGKAAWRFRKGIIIFAVAITVIALITEYVTPALANGIVALGDGVSAGADAIGTGAAHAWQGVPIIIGIVLALAYWTFVSVKWIGNARSNNGRMARQVGAFAVFLPLMIGYIAVFVA